LQAENARSGRSVDTGGEGRALVLLPGSVGTCEVFFKQVMGLGRTRRVIAVTYPAEPDPQKLAEGLARLLEQLGLAAPDIIGSSFAAYWLQAFALAHPDGFTTLVLGNGFVEPSRLVTLPAFNPAFVRETSAQELQHGWRERVLAAPESELRSLQLDMLSGRQPAVTLKSRLLGVTTAALLAPPPSEVQDRIAILECEDDPLISAETRRRMQDHLPGARVITLPTGGHYPHILVPDLYEAALRTLLT